MNNTPDLKDLAELQAQVSLLNGHVEALLQQRENTRQILDSYRGQVSSEISRLRRDVRVYKTLVEKLLNQIESKTPEANRLKEQK